MSGKLENKYGTITIDEDVIAKAAGLTAIECYGVVGMAIVNVANGIAKLLKRESMTQGISLNIEDNAVSIDFHVILEYGVNIKTVTDNLISAVTFKVEDFTGLEVKNVNVYVEDIRVDE